MAEKDPARIVALRRVDVFRPDGSAPRGIAAEPGDAQYDPGRGELLFACPGCGLWGGIRVGHPKPAEPPSWDVRAGDPAAPETLTLHPSILCRGCCGWHGWLTAGVFTTKSPGG